MLFKRKLNTLAQGLEKAKLTNNQLEAEAREAEKTDKANLATIAKLKEQISEVSKNAKRESDVKLSETEKAIRAETAMQISKAQKEAKAAIETAEQRVANQLEIQQQKLEDQMAKVSSSASALSALQDRA